MNKLARSGVDVQALVEVLLYDLVDTFNFAKNMSKEQVEKCAMALIDTYWNYSPEDFIRCCANIKQSKYLDKMFESFDESKIHFCFGRYDLERQEEIFQLRQKESSDWKQANKEPLLGEAINQQLKEYANTLIDKAKPKESKPREKTESEKIMDELIHEFDELYSNQGKGVGGQRFVLYDGKMRNIDDYCNYRFSQLFKS